MEQVSLIFNIAPSYRASIYKLIDQNFECKWYFGSNYSDIKKMDLNVFKECHELQSKLYKYNLYYIKNSVKIFSESKSTIFILTGEPFCLSNWAILLKNKITGNKKKVYLWSHGWYGREGFAKRFIKKIFFSLADGTFLYGNYAREIAIKQGNNPNKLWVIHNSLNHEKHLLLRQNLSENNVFKKHFNNTNKNIIFIGRLTKVKRLDIIIDAVAYLAQQNEFYNIILVGDGTEKGFLEDKARKLNIPIWFYGESFDEMTNANLIYNADLCVAPGNVGLTAIHTMAFGTPVITHGSFANQMPEFEAIRAGETGDFFEEGSVESLALKISEWFTKHYDREAVRKKCQEEIDNYWTPEYQLEVIKKNIDNI